MKAVNHIESDNPTAIRLIKCFGSLYRLSKVLKIDPSNVSRYIKKDFTIPIRHAIKIEILSKGKIRASELRPDIMRGYKLTEAMHD